MQRSFVLSQLEDINKILLLCSRCVLSKFQECEITPNMYHIPNIGPLPSQAIYFVY